MKKLTAKQLENLMNKCLGDPRPNGPFNGIHHDSSNHVAVASNGHVALVSKQAFCEDNAGKIIAKDGHVINAKYANYDAVLKPFVGVYLKYPYVIDPATLELQVRRYNALRKAKLVSKNALVILDSRSPFAVRGEYAKLMAAYSTTGWRINQTSTHAAVNCSDDGMFIVMPVITSDIGNYAPHRAIKLFDEYGIYDYAMADFHEKDVPFDEIKAVLSTLK